MRNIRLPVSLNDATCRITESASATNTPPTSTSQNSRLMSTATMPSAPPSISEPVSPMNTSAGWQFHHRKPSAAPKTAAQNTVSSPLVGR